MSIYVHFFDVSVDMRIELDINMEMCERKIVDIWHRIALIVGESDIGIDKCKCLEIRDI